MIDYHVRYGPANNEGFMDIKLHQNFLILISKDNFSIKETIK